MKQQIKIDGGYYLSDSLPLTAQQCINLYPHQPLTEGSISAGALFRTPGISQLQYIGIGAGTYAETLSVANFYGNGQDWRHGDIPPTGELVN